MKISIIISAYNVEKYIEKCIYSCVQQNYDRNLYEIIVVNDGSTDSTAQLLIQLESESEIVKVVHQGNTGLGASRNEGLKISKGEYVWFIDGDDYIKENVLQEIVYEIEKNNLDVLTLNYSVVDTDYKSISTHSNELVGINDLMTGSEFYKSNYSKSYTWLFLFKKNLFINGQIQFENRMNMQDSVVLPELLIITDRLSFLNRICYYYVQQSESFTNSSRGDKRYAYFESIIKVRKSLLEFLNNNVMGNVDMRIGINRKLDSLHEVVFNHLVYYQYEEEWFIKIIKLLKSNNFYPLKNKPRGKLRMIKLGMNLNPLLTKKALNFIRNIKTK